MTTGTQDVPLSQIPPEQWAEIRRVYGDPALRRRLYALGFLPGERVRVEREAPLKDPVAYWVKGTWVALRRTDAARIRVRPLAREEAA